MQEKEKQSLIRKVLSHIFLSPILNPLGYLIVKQWKMSQGKEIAGLSVDIYSYKATVKKGATLRERFIWFIEGSLLVVGALMLKQFWSEIQLTLFISWTVGLYGVFAIIASLLPYIDWNRNRGQKFRILLYLLFFSIIFGFIFFVAFSVL